ncbi:MAG: hypothetical protein U9O24_06560 [Campylobacterota bacterium]|nr:hypothetical protein [Campylobacterota bacterium]
METCPACKGSGKCTYCEGTGKYSDGNDCKQCHGSGKCSEKTPAGYRCHGTGEVAKI